MSAKDKDRWQVSTGWSTNATDPVENMYYGLEYRRKQQGMPHGAAASAPQIVNGSGPSNSEVYLNGRTRRPMSQAASSKLTQTRQEYIAEINERAASVPRPNLGIASAVAPVPSLRKAASVAASNQGRLNSSANSTHMAPDVYSPLFLTQNLQLPRDRQTANAWNRAFYETNPYVRNAINLHATYPISKLNIKCEDKKVEQFFQDMADRLDLHTVVQNTALEFWKLGEVFCYANFNETDGCWDHIFHHNPDFIRVRASPLQTNASIISLRADPELEKIVTSTDPEHVRIREQIDPKIINHVLKNEAIPLDNFNVSHLKMLNSPYDVRGTSIITSIWKDLMLYDKIRECKLVQADGMINPMTLIKIGSPGTDGHYPRQDELDAWRSIFEQAQYDKDFKIVTHDGVAVERVGFSGAVLDVGNDIQLILDAILTGLMVPKSIMTQEGTAYASASVALDVMRQRYISFRTMMANWLEKKIFAPISEVQGFYKLSAGKKKLIVPQIEWNHMTLHDVDSYIGHISTLAQANKVSQKTLDYSLGLNRNNEMVNLREEAIQKAILQREVEALEHMTLAELRALDPEEPIVAPEKSPLPGVKPLKGNEPGGDMAGGAGGLPPLDLGGGGGGGLDLSAPTPSLDSGAPMPGGGPEEPPAPSNAPGG